MSNINVKIIIPAEINGSKYPAVLAERASVLSIVLNIDRTKDKMSPNIEHKVRSFSKKFK